MELRSISYKNHIFCIKDMIYSKTQLKANPLVPNLPGLTGLWGHDPILKSGGSETLDRAVAHVKYYLIGKNRKDKNVNCHVGVIQEGNVKVSCSLTIGASST